MAEHPPRLAPGAVGDAARRGRTRGASRRAAAATARRRRRGGSCRRERARRVETNGPTPARAGAGRSWRRAPRYLFRNSSLCTISWTSVRTPYPPAAARSQDPLDLGPVAEPHRRAGGVDDELPRRGCGRSARSSVEQQPLELADVAERRGRRAARRWHRPAAPAWNVNGWPFLPMPGVRRRRRPSAR